MLHQKDGIGLILFDQKIQSFIPPRTTSNHLNTILSQLDKIQPGEDTKIGDVLHEMADRIKKRGLVILISDLFDDFDSVMILTQCSDDFESVDSVRILNQSTR